MLTDTKLKSLKAQDKAYKVPDRDGLYVVVSPKGTVTFRYDYRFNGRRATLTIGRYGDDAMSLAEAREKLTEARKKIHDGISPAQEKADGKKTIKNTDRFAAFADIWLRDSDLAESTVGQKMHTLKRDVLPAFGNKLLEEITSSQIMALCDSIKSPPRSAPAVAIHVREVINSVFSHAIARGLKITNPAASIRPSAIAKFKPRDRVLTSDEVRIFFKYLDKVGTLPTLKLAIKFLLLTMVRKGELQMATWSEVDFETATWTIPKERMKMSNAHVVYLSDQAMDIIMALKTCAGGSSYLLPGRYDSDLPTSNATFNVIFDKAIVLANENGETLETLSPHDFRRTASTHLHEMGFNTDWIEKCLAHEQKGVRKVYNKAEYSEQRREMLQAWANIVDGWITGAKVIPFNSSTKQVA